MSKPSVMNVVAFRARPTFVGALWLAFILALPVGVTGLILEQILQIWAN